MSALIRSALIIVTVAVIPGQLVGVWNSLKADTPTDRALMLMWDVIFGGSMWIVLLHAWGIIG